jgi:shikimate kinase
VDVIVARIQSSTQRPALTFGKTFTEEVSEVLEQRLPKYKCAAQYEIDTDKLTPAQVADRIVEIWLGAGRSKTNIAKRGGEIQ